MSDSECWVGHWLFDLLELWRWTWWRCFLLGLWRWTWWTSLFYLLWTARKYVLAKAITCFINGWYFWVHINSSLHTVWKPLHVQTLGTRQSVGWQIRFLRKGLQLEHRGYSMQLNLTLNLLLLYTYPQLKLQPRKLTTSLSVWMLMHA